MTFSVSFFLQLLDFLGYLLDMACNLAMHGVMRQQMGWCAKARIQLIVRGFSREEHVIDNVIRLQLIVMINYTVVL